MSLPTTRLAYADAYDAFDQALADSVGIRIQFDTEEQAKHFRFRLNYARQMDRDDNRKTYAPDHPLFGKSAYDRLVARIRREQEDGKWYLYLETSLNPDQLVIQSLAKLYEKEPEE